MAREYAPQEKKQPELQQTTGLFPELHKQTAPMDWRQEESEKVTQAEPRQRQKAGFCQKNFARIPLGRYKNEPWPKLPAIARKSGVIQGKMPPQRELRVQPPLQRQQLQRKNRMGLPGGLKAGLENLSGYSMDGVRVHYNSPKPVQVNALAYTQGQNIYVGPGQEKHLPHEGWHVVQQMQGRVKPTIKIQGKGVNDDVRLEKEADLMGGKALQTDGAVSPQAKSRANEGAELQPLINSRRLPAIQRAIGLEAEMGRGVASKTGKKL
ncbi:MAG: DUF4157 domain-containing protein [Cyanobacteria bacterium J06641_5]